MHIDPYQSTLSRWNGVEINLSSTPIHFNTSRLKLIYMHQNKASRTNHFSLCGLAVCKRNSNPVASYTNSLVDSSIVEYIVVYHHQLERFGPPQRVNDIRAHEHKKLLVVIWPLAIGSASTTDADADTSTRRTPSHHGWSSTACMLCLWTPMRRPRNFPCYEQTRSRLSVLRKPWLSF
jgi:hypothetical protein